MFVGLVNYIISSFLSLSLKSDMLINSPSKHPFNRFNLSAKRSLLLIFFFPREWVVEFPPSRYLHGLWQLANITKFSRSCIFPVYHFVWLVHLIVIYLHETARDDNDDKWIFGSNETYCPKYNLVKCVLSKRKSISSWTFPE